MKKTHALPPLLLAILLFSSCLQHHFQITVKEDGSVEYQYTVSGDSADLYDNLNALPQGIPWSVEKYTTLDTSQGKMDTVYHYRAKAPFAPGAQLPSSFGLDYVSFAQVCQQHPLTVKRQDLFFMVNYIFEFKFPSRLRSELYGKMEDFIPEECSLLDKSDSLDEKTRDELQAKQLAGMRVWAQHLYRNRFLQALQQSLKMHPELKPDTTKIQQAQSALDQYLELAIQRFEPAHADTISSFWKKISPRGFSILEEHLNFLGDTIFFADMRTAGDIFNLEYEVTSDLGDDNFLVEATLPGAVRSSNADTTIAKTLKWEFQGENLADSTIVLSAVSTIYRPTRLYIAGGIILLGIILALRAILKPSNQRQT